MRLRWAMILLVTCNPEAPSSPTEAVSVTATATATVAPLVCTPGPLQAMSVTFFDVGQALAALVQLPDGRLVLVDSGDDPGRSDEQCHGACRAWHDHFMEKLRARVGQKPIDMIWITHQHSDHLGGALDVIANFKVARLVDNGQDLGKKEVRKLHEEASAHGVSIGVVGPDQRAVSMPASPGVRFTAVVPSSWPVRCGDKPNDCSIALRIDDCQSSVLFVGDAEKLEEAQLDPGHATLLQVGHHGSETSSSDPFLDKIKPSYAVISCAKKGEGTNETYCHPREPVITRLDRVLGDSSGPTVVAFDGKRHCTRAGDEHWHPIGASSHLFVTARDGDVTLETIGDGKFERR